MTTTKDFGSSIGQTIKIGKARVTNAR